LWDYATASNREIPVKKVTNETARLTSFGFPVSFPLGMTAAGHLSFRMVDAHRKRLLEKLNQRNNEELPSFAMLNKPGAT